MNASYVDKILCPRCEATLPFTAEVCPHCGSATRPIGQPGAGSDDAGGPSAPPLLDRPWVVLSLLFFVMAILGLPLLWKSRAFSLAAKIVLSIVVTLYTLALFAGVGAICVWAYRRVVEAM
ncbi:MAG: hypothetical protein J5I93_19900 [Pirellulaceae bacterium]|nr:hypothetical protein [Pirellulaceae bacterium]